MPRPTRPPTRRPRPRRCTSRARRGGRCASASTASIPMPSSRARGSGRPTGRRNARAPTGWMNELQTFYRARTKLGVNVFPEDVAEAIVLRGGRTAKSTGNVVETSTAAWPSLAVTIGTLTLYRGIAQGILPTDTIGGFPTYLTNIGVVPISGTHIPYSIAFFAVLAVIFAVVLHATPLGRAIFAIGSGQEAAFFAGIRVKRIKFWLFVLSGILSGFAGVLWSLRFASARYDSGVGLELFVVTAVLLGGISIFGGRGTIAGVVPRGCSSRHAADGSDRRPRSGTGSEHRRRRSAPCERDHPECPRAVSARPGATAECGSPEALPRPRRRRNETGGCPEGRHLRHRPRRLLAAVRGAAGTARGVPAEDPGAAGVARRRDVVSVGLVDTAQRARETPERPWPRRAWISCSSTRRPTRRRHRCSRLCRRFPRPWSSSTSNLHALGRLRHHDNRRVARQLLGVLRPGDRRRIRARSHPVQNGDRDTAR